MKPKNRKNLQRTLRLCLGGTAALAGVNLGHGPALAQDAGRLEKLEQENQALRKRLEALENMAQKEGLTPSGEASKTMPVKALSEITLNGFVSASYFYNSSEPADGLSDGYLWTTRHNSFSLNKVKLTLASKPAERSGEEWDAGFRVSMIWGEDAPVVNTGGEQQGFEALREAYVDLNIPVGTGLNFKAGQLISLLNWESGDGGAANPNFSQGYQWFYTGNGPSAGIQLGYNLTEWLDVKARLHNGLYAGPVDGNNGKAFMASVGIKPDSKSWISLIGFGGDGNATLDVHGASVLAGRQFTPKLGTGFEFDYFMFDPNGGSDSDLWSVGAWVWYDFTPTIGLAFRGEYLDDQDGGGIKGIGPRSGAAIGVLDPGDPTADPVIPPTLSPESSGELASLTLTLNWKPVPNIKIQPEVRYDHTSYTGGFDGKKDRVVAGLGVSYLF
jgi:hypothetical protein